MRVDSSRLHEKRVHILAEPVTREHERERLAGRLELREALARLGRRPDADHAVVAFVPVEELPLDGGKCRRLGIDGEDDRRAHRPVIVVRARRRA